MEENNQGQQWSEQYKSLRSSIFKERTEIKKLLSFNMTTIMLKKDLVKMEQSVENEEFNREIEGKQIFDNIRSLKKQQKSLLQLLTKPVLNKEDLLQQVEKYNNQYNEFKDQQINIFEAMISEQSNLQQELEQFDIRLQNSQISASKADSESSDNPKMYTTFKSTAQNLNQVEEQPEDDDEEQDDENQYYKDEFETFEDGEEQQQQQDLQSKGKKSQPISAKQQSSAQKKKDEDLEENQAQLKDRFNEEIETIESQIDVLDNQISDVKQKMSDIEQKIEKNGGVSCGWKKEDHQEFLALKNKHKSQFQKQQFQQEYKQHMGYFSEIELQQHIDKYTKYIELDTQRKTLLEKYNELKNMRQKKQQEIKDKEKEKDLLQVKAKKDTIDKHKLEEKKAVVHKWKATKLTQQDIEYELKELSYQKYKRQQILQKEQQVKELAQKKALVLEFQAQKQQKKEEEIKQMTEFAELQKQQVPKKVVERINKKELIMLKKKQKAMLEKQIQQEDKLEKDAKIIEESKNKLQQKNIEGKLLQSTAANQARQRQKFVSKQDRFQGSDNQGFIFGQPQGRAVPEWRQNI